MNTTAVIIYLIILGSTLFSSKFVLTTLGFQYPTVFQGWQTLVGFLLYRGLHSCGVISITAIDRAGLVSLLPSFLFFTGSILSGSMALSKTPILSFVAMSSCIPALTFLLTDPDALNPKKKRIQLVASTWVLFSSLLLVGLEQVYGGHEGYFWAEVHILFTVANVVYSKITDARYDSIDRQYFCYGFSFILLLPASLYVNEAFEALNFKELYQIMFIVGSLVCAISGMLASFYQTRLRADKNFGLTHHLTLGVAAVVSLVPFELDLWTTWSVPIALSILVAQVFVPSYINPEEVLDSDFFAPKSNLFTEQTV